MKVGPHAMRIVEPRQARKGATVRRPSRVPWEYLTGAGFLGRSRYGSFDWGCTVTVSEREIGLKRGWAERDGRGSAPAVDRFVVRRGVDRSAVERLGVVRRGVDRPAVDGAGVSGLGLGT